VVPIPEPITFSICIPQHNRSRYLLAVLDSLRTQRYPHFEVVVSDDGSTDDTAEVVPAYLEASGMRYRFHRKERNLGYDANLRASLALGTGDYLLILGNDDALADENALADLAGALESHGRPEVAISNYRFWTADGDGAEVRRVPQTTLLPGGPTTAIDRYRDFAFVAGIVFARDAFTQANTSSYDGSIFVQVYLGCKVITDGGRLLLWNRALVAKDVKVGGQPANSYKDVERQRKRKLEPHSQGVSSIAWVACEAVFSALTDPVARNQALIRIYKTLLRYTYPYWLYAHRKESFWRAAFCMAWGCYPTILLKPVEHPWWVTLKLFPTYTISTIAGFFLPVSLLSRLMPWGYRLSKRLPKT